ncbi:MAG: glutamine-hydrolyzing carbamoyl-phosphate synthase small subunit, partial [Verrucomicrobiales bacterium]
MKKALLALEDGTVFEGDAFGAEGTRTGEICFNTSMTGYQEVITDPSYRGQIVAMTYPQIGNYGVNALDAESREPHIRGFVIEELCEVPSNWRSEGTLAEYFAGNGIVGIQGIDTRSLTKRLRTAGAMRAALTTELGADDAVAKAKASPSMAGMDYVKEVTTESGYHWDEAGAKSREWVQVNMSVEGGPRGEAPTGDAFKPLPPAKYRIVAYDFGVKFNILRRLRQEGFDVQVVNARATAEEVLAHKPDGVFLSNGPGDPAALGYVHEEVRKLIGKAPIFAICLGHQILAHAFGGKTFKLKFGHRGANQPVKDLRSGAVAITSQNHGFAVDPDSL